MIMMGCMPLSFADLVFIGERIEVGLRRGKFDYIALMNRKPGANEENKKDGGTHAVTVVLAWPNFPPAQQYQYSASISLSHYPSPYQPRPPNHPKRPPLNQPKSSLATHPIPNTTLNTNQNTNQGRNLPEKKPVEFTPTLVSYANLFPYLLNNAMVTMILAKIPQPPFSQGYNSNATCAYHGGVPGHSIEHCMTLKHKVKSLINAGLLKLEEDNHLVMEVNTTIVIATSTTTEVDPTHPSGINQASHPVPDMVGQAAEHWEDQNKHSFSPYCLSPKYTPYNVAHASNENVNNSTPILIKSQQPRSDHAHVSQPMGGHMKCPETTL
ncbi:hypothetical protein HKD37_07G018733 [Glycine soja]